MAQTKTNKIFDRKKKKLSFDFTIDKEEREQENWKEKSSSLN